MIIFKSKTLSLFNFLPNSLRLEGDWNETISLIRDTSLRPKGDVNLNEWLI